MTTINKQDCIIKEIWHNRVKVYYEPLEGISGYVLFDVEQVTLRYNFGNTYYVINKYEFTYEDGTPYEPSEDILDQFQAIIESALL